MCRVFGVKNQRDAEATDTAIDSMGRWTKGARQGCYDLGISYEGLRSAAGFGKEKGSVMWLRTRVIPPESLQKLIFPWIEQQELIVKANLESKKYNTEIAAEQFLERMKVERRIFLQDAAEKLDLVRPFHFVSIQMRVNKTFFFE